MSTATIAAFRTRFVIFALGRAATLLGVVYGVFAWSYWTYAVDGDVMKAASALGIAALGFVVSKGAMRCPSCGEDPNCQHRFDKVENHEIELGGGWVLRKEHTRQVVAVHNFFVGLFDPPHACGSCGETLKGSDDEVSVDEDDLKIRRFSLTSLPALFVYVSLALGLWFFWEFSQLS